MSDFEAIMIGLWKMAWAWIPCGIALIVAGIFEKKHYKEDDDVYM